MTKHVCLSALLSSSLIAVAACGGDDDTTGDETAYETQATLDVKKYVQGQLERLSTAAKALQSAAPAADDDGWNATDDGAAVEKMRDVWADARDTYERVEGSIAVLFGELDKSTDERYDGFLNDDGPDDNLFDGEGVTGVHAIERILWADAQSARVVAFEKTVPGYKAAAFPANADEAKDFKQGLCERLVKDVEQMQDEYATVALDSSAAFRGMIGSMAEQSEKTTLAASGEDESRYAEHTLADMRANLEGAAAVFKAFKPWVTSSNSAETAKEIEAGLAEISDAYSAVDGAALPEVPQGFNPDKPTDADLETAYGKLWSLLTAQTDMNSDDSLVSKMTSAADKMGIAEFEE